VSGPRAIWLGDLLRARALLGPLDEAQTAFVARLLGLAPVAHVPWDVTHDEPSRPAAEDIEDDLDAAHARSHDMQIPSATGESERPAHARLEPVGRVPGATMRPWEEVEALEPYVSERHGAPLPHEPLWEPRWTRELVTAALATSTAGLAIDERRAVDVIARARPLTVVPRVPRRTLALGVQVLVDVGEGMAPYARDRTRLAGEIREVVGRTRTSVLRFSGSPARGAGPGARPAWRRYVPPDHGTPVVALTDLGIGASSLDAGARPTADWLDVACRLERRDSRLIALVPYPPRRWPMPLRRAITIVHWDRTTTVAEVLERVARAERRR
jgi:hypothetical protein